MEKNKKKVTIELKTATLWKAGTIIFAVLFIISIMTGGFKGSGSVAPTQQVVVPTQAPPGQPPAPTIVAEVDVKGEPMLGKKNAPVTIVEFTDYQCPFCGRAFTNTFPEIKKLADEGKVVYYVKDYPLPFHTEADEASKAANCAAKQDSDAYWIMHDKLFNTQGSWSGNPDVTTLFTGYATELGLDESKFTKCMNDPAMDKEIQDDISEGSAIGVSGTPSFTINGQLLVGAQPWSAFKTIIDAELAQ